MAAKGKIQIVPPEQADVDAQRQGGIPTMVSTLTEPHYKLCYAKPLRAYKPWKKTATFDS
jgi:hypothetical protein